MASETGSRTARTLSDALGTSEFKEGIALPYKEQRLLLGFVGSLLQAIALDGLSEALPHVMPANLFEGTGVERNHAQIVMRQLPFQKATNPSAADKWSWVPDLNHMVAACKALAGTGMMHGTPTTGLENLRSTMESLLGCSGFQEIFPDKLLNPA
jgi:hypothetical protein